MPLPRDTPASLPPPAAFGRYRVVHQVGAGVLGPVFRGYDPEHDRAVAIKAFSLDLTPEQAREVAADLGRLPSLSLKHPSIIAPYAAGADGSTAYLVQEYFVAESADVALKQYGPAPIPDAMRLIGQLAGALDFASAAGVHHGALHPRDILVAPHEVRVSGIGVVEALERVGFRPPVRRPYAAPERANGAPIGCPTDVFSLAGVSYELLTGRRPSAAGDAASVDVGTFESADRAALAEVFARALSVQPEDRFKSALSFAAALKHALTGEPLVGAEPVERPRARRAPRAAGRKDAPESPGLVVVPEDRREVASPPPASSDAAGGDLPLTDPTPVPLSAEPAPGSTPLPAFLQTYQRPEADVAPVETMRPAEAAETPPERPQPVAEEPRRALDFEDPDRRIDVTAPIPPPVDAAYSQGDEALRADEPSGPVLDRFERQAVSRFDPAADDAEEAAPVAEEPVQPSLALDEPERRESTPPGPTFESVTPLGSPPDMEKPKSGLWSHLGMLLIGVLIAFPAGYLVAPKGAPSVTPVAPSGPAQAPTPSPAAPAQAAPSGPGSGSAQPPVAAPGQQAAPPAVPGGQATGVAEPMRQSAAPAPAKPAPAPARPTAGPKSEGKPAERGVAPKPTPAAPKPAPKPAAETTRKPVRAAAPATAPAAKDTAVAAGAQAAVRARFEGSLIVASKPDGATVQLDGRVVGQTPLSLQAVSAGAHAIRLELAGYQIWSSSTQVTAGKVNRVTASLERRPGG